MYNKAILVHADARIKDAQEILETFMNREMEIDPENETDNVLINFYKGKPLDKKNTFKG